MDMSRSVHKDSYIYAKELIRKTAEQSPDVIVLPETWNTGFLPKKEMEPLCDRDGCKTKKEIGGLAKELGINIVAGSVANIKNNKIYNTAYVFDRNGNCVGEYDKIHLFTPMGEHEHFEKGDNLCKFTLDGKACGVIICYDIRFPELTRTLTVNGLDYLFVPAQWPEARISHFETLSKARAIENQMFVIRCNSCGKSGGTVYGGSSAVIDPWGEVLASADKDAAIILADCDHTVIENIRNSINVFADRRPEMYNVN